MTERGAILPGVLMVLLVLTIFIPPMVVFVQREAVSTVKQKRSTTAFYAAMSGVDRALYKLKSSTGTFDEVLDGAIPAGYRFDVIYKDITTGSYQVAMSSTSTSKQIAVYSMGRDTVAKEFRRIEVLLKRDSVVAAIYSPTVEVSGSGRVFWGPLMSKGNLDMAGSANLLYPRKFARGQITANGSYPSRDTSSNAPNTDGKEWWSYNEPPGVPDPLPIDLDYYRALAKLELGCPAGGTPAGSCYYVTAQNWNDTKSNVNKTYFFESNAKFAGSKHLRGTMIIMGDLDMAGTAYGTDCSGPSDTNPGDYGCYRAAIPATAHKEYQKNTPAGGDAGACPGAYPLGGGGSGAQDDLDYNNGAEAEGDDCKIHQYPGDIGTASTETFKFGRGCDAHGNTAGASTENMAFKGFIFVKGDSKLVGSVAVNGAFMSDSGSFSGGGSLTIYFDESLEVRVTNITISQVSWMELPGVAF